MMRVVTLVACLAPPFISVGAIAAASGPTAVYNEAVKVVAGVRQVQLPPHSNDPRFKHIRPIPRNDEEERYTVLFMVETPSGLTECTLPVAHEDRYCRPSTYGRKKLLRSWVVLREGKWMACADPQKVVPPKPSQHPRFPIIDSAHHCAEVRLTQQGNALVYSFALAAPKKEQ